MKILLYVPIPLIVFFLTTSLSAQAPATPGAPAIEIAYDASDNRISRKIIYLSVKSADNTEQQTTANQKTPEAVYTDEVGETHVTVYPNPTKGTLTVAVENPGDNPDAEAVIYDLQNRQLLKQAFSGAQNPLDLSAFPNGQYIMLIRIGADVSNWKIIKQ